MDLGSRVMSLLGKENVVHLFLAGAFVALGVRSSAQQDEIDALEVEKESLRRSNKAMQKAMWDWRQSLFHLAESDPSNSPISLSKLRAIFGDEDAAAAAAATSPAAATTAFVAAIPTSQNADTDISSLQS
ncbi:hypothetical protein Taro_001595 [Colocasia esculenta]|uniref:Uncharacterized protein n=1 Tax=Colocasia esculenta TaxID=4460 RepID=A0A843TAG9_COLES|nr:hypothetical protein [Colocasia esculenta]